MYNLNHLSYHFISSNLIFGTIRPTIKCASPEASDKVDLFDTNEDEEDSDSVSSKFS